MNVTVSKKKVHPKMDEPYFYRLLLTAGLVHGAAFPVLPDFTQGVSTKKQAVDECQRNRHSPEPMKFLLQVFSAVSSAISCHMLSLL